MTNGSHQCHSQHRKLSEIQQGMTKFWKQTDLLTEQELYSNVADLLQTQQLRGILNIQHST
jgi:hypothetical protein